MIPATSIGKIPVDDESSTASTLHCQYKFLKMSYEKSSVDNKCQSQISNIIKCVAGAANSQDYILRLVG